MRAGGLRFTRPHIGTGPPLGRWHSTAALVDTAARTVKVFDCARPFRAGAEIPDKRHAPTTPHCHTRTGCPRQRGAPGALRLPKPAAEPHSTDRHARRNTRAAHPARHAPHPALPPHHHSDRARPASTTSLPVPRPDIPGLAAGHPMLAMYKSSPVSLSDAVNCAVVVKYTLEPSPRGANEISARPRRRARTRHFPRNPVAFADTPTKRTRFQRPRHFQRPRTTQTHKQLMRIGRSSRVVAPLGHIVKNTSLPSALIALYVSPSLVKE